jgi:hypothetical protein
MMDVLDFIVNFSLNDVFPGLEAIAIVVCFGFVVFVVSQFIWLNFTKRGKQKKEYLNSLPENCEKELNEFMPTEIAFKCYNQRNKLHKLELKAEEERIQKLFKEQ